MTSRDFCYWLQGFFEINAAGTKDAPSPPSVFLGGSACETIKKHLAMVFVHEIDPSAGPLAHQAALNLIHDAPSGPPPHIGGPDGPGGIKYRC